MMYIWSLLNKPILTLNILEVIIVLSITIITIILADFLYLFLATFIKWFHKRNETKC